MPAARRRTKIVCTIGPATRSEAALRRLARAGMDVARLNFSYGSHEEHGEVIARLRAVSEALGKPIGILQDLGGPKLRVGQLPGGEMNLKPRQEVVISVARRPAPEHVPVALPALAQAVSPGDRLLLSDGRIELKVMAVEGEAIHCQVVVGGCLKSHQGLNLPDTSLPVPAVTRKDLEDLRFGLQQGVDWVAMSFVRRAQDLAPLRRALAGAARPPGVLAKIETHEAVARLDEIVAACDGVMVARGDLGVELPLARVPLLQKAIISRCNDLGKPVVTATQMLESMVSNPRPTRAEVSDVANAVFDGTDGVMLSGETAVGRYPVEAVKVMDRVLSQAEAALDFDARLTESSAWRSGEVTDAIGEAACGLAHDLEAAAIITATTSGHTAMKVAMYRPEAPIVAVTPHVATLTRLTLVWGVHPLVAARGRNTDELVVNALARAEEAGFVRPGDRVVVTAGVPPGPGHTNLVKVEVVGRHDAF